MTEAGWTSNVPANEGEYWFRSDGVRKPIVAHVYLDVEQDLRIIIGINDLYVTDLDGFDEFDGAEFLGPISPTDRQQGRVAGLVRGAQLVRWHKSCAFEADPALALERAAKDIESVASQIIQPQQAQKEKGEY